MLFFHPLELVWKQHSGIKGITPTYNLQFVWQIEDIIWNWENTYIKTIMFYPHDMIKTHWLHDSYKTEEKSIH